MKFMILYIEKEREGTLMNKQVKPTITVVTNNGNQSYMAVGVCHCN